MRTNIIRLLVIILTAALTGCNSADKKLTEEMKANLARFKEVTLTTDLDWLSNKEKEIVSILMDAADIMDDIFWMEAFGDKEELFSRIKNEYARDYMKIHYGPWDRLNNNAPLFPDPWKNIQAHNSIRQI